MTHKESTASLNEVKPHIFKVLEKLDQSEQEILQVIFYFYPNFARLSFLQDASKLSGEKIENSVRKISEVLEKHSNYEIQKSNGYKLRHREPTPSFFAVWSSFSSTQRAIFLSIVTNSSQRLGTPAEIRHIQRKIQDALPGTLQKDHSNVYRFIPTGDVTSAQLAADLTAYMAWEASLFTADAGSGQPETE